MKSLTSFKMCLLITLCCSSSLVAQYVYHSQSSFPIYTVPNNSLHSKNYILAKEANKKGYLMASNTRMPNGVINLTAIKIKNNLYLDFFRHFTHSSAIYNYFHELNTLDIKGTSDGGYIACGQIMDSTYRYAFIIKFDAKIKPEWFKSYQNIFQLKSILEVINPDNKASYTACGDDRTGAGGQGIILAVDKLGVPVWVRRSDSNNNNDLISYNEIIQVSPKIIPSKKALFALVGNALTNPEENKDVIISVIDIDGNIRYSIIYGIQNNRYYTFDEEGLGITVTDKSKFLISGRTRFVYINYPFPIWDDVLLFQIDMESAALDWAKRYDMIGNNSTGEFGEKVEIQRDTINVTGHYKGYLFNPDASDDAFIFKTSIDGKPIKNIVFGSELDDLLYKIERNNDDDGVITAGFSNSFTGTGMYAPWVVEAYSKVKDTCHNLEVELPAFDIELPYKKTEHIKFKSKFKKEELEELNIPIDERIICPKIKSTLPFKNTNKISLKSNIMINPTITRNRLYITGINKKFAYKIFNVNGTIFKVGNIDIDQEIDISGLNQGLYYITVSSNGESITEKFVKQAD